MLKDYKLPSLRDKYAPKQVEEVKVEKEKKPKSKKK